MGVRSLSIELAEKARVELNEEPNRIASDLKFIKDWLSKQPHLRACTDDQWLVSFLRSCTYSLERTKEKLDLYYSLRTVAPELFNVKHDYPKFDELLSLGALLVLPETATPTSPRTIMIRPGTFSPDKFNISEVFAFIYIVQKILIFNDDITTVSGIQWIIDLKDVTIGHLLQMTPSVINKMVYSTQESAPIRMKGSHFVNAPANFGKVLNTMKVFLNEKNKSTLYVHQNYEDLYKHIPKKMLPKDFGGDSVSIKEITDSWTAKWKEFASWLKEDMKNGTDESKRPGRPKTAESIFGVEGSFRRLDFD
ncbi:retinol-binding protein pinta-like [Melitaea cinxia]|uniref:retinol-binding protein pinta-like n=1 Tax=Melitaea cinxia TaxID=113334 RepID=UPI001E2747E6|nr:retinol-binding protein pinta-like [Melitaea cinxia]